MTDSPPTHCMNCGAQLRGPYCHACGQPVKGMVRHLRSILQDFLDTVFEYDSRIWRTLLPLYFRPGHITSAFLEGRRVRFVSPFRLFFVLTVVAFLTLQLVVEPLEVREETVGSAIRDADTVEEVEAVRDAALAELVEARSSLEESIDNPRARAGASAGMEAAARAIRQNAAQRIEWLHLAEAARAEGVEPPPPPAGVLTFGEEPWHEVLNPLEIPWLPAAANAQVNRWIGRAAGNLAAAQDDPDRLVDAFLGLLPAALFVLMPLFAGLLKLFYLRKRWLYTAHLVVALHSHSFLALALLISVLLSSLTQASADTPWLLMPLGALTVAAQVWIPVHLLLMQHRVYGQGWGRTVLKFTAIGTLYALMLVFAAAAAAVVTLVVT